jgi:hypothetical protein
VLAAAGPPTVVNDSIRISRSSTEELTLHLYFVQQIATIVGYRLGNEEYKDRHLHLPSAAGHLISVSAMCKY